MRYIHIYREKKRERERVTLLMNKRCCDKMFQVTKNKSKCENLQKKNQKEQKINNKGLK